MIIMAEIAPKGTFEDDAECIYIPYEMPQKRSYYDFDRNYEETA